MAGPGPGEPVAGDGADPGALGHRRFQILEIGEGRFRGDIAPVGDRVQYHRNTALGDRLDRSDDVVQMAMHPAIRHQPHQMGGAARRLELGDEALQGVVGEEAAILDRQVDLAQVHRHHPAGADIGMADLGIAHLAAGQPDIGAVGDQPVMRAVGHDPVEIRGIGQRGGVGLRFFAETPAVENAQNNRFGMSHGLPFVKLPAI